MIVSALKAEIMTDLHDLVTSSVHSEVKGKMPRMNRANGERRLKWECDETDEFLLDGKSKETVRKYKRAINDLHVFLFNSKCADLLMDASDWFRSIKYKHLLMWRKHVIETASTFTKQPRVAAVKSLFKCLRQRDHIPVDTARDLSLPSKAKSTTTRYLSKDDVHRAVASAKQRNAIDLGLVCGMYYAMLREKEIRRIKREDCSFVADPDDGAELLCVHVR